MRKGISPKETRIEDLNQDKLRSGSDLVGQQYGRLTVLRHVGYKRLNDKRKQRYYYVECQCACLAQTVVIVGVSNILSGTTKSCGCFNLERIIERTTTHNLSNTPTYSSWHSMINRCKHPNNPRYHDYGGRGITYDPRWRYFSAFLEDMGEKPFPEYSIERINNSGNYCKENCMWALIDVQASNKRNNIHVFYKGDKMTLKQCAKVSGKIYTTLCYQIKQFRKINPKNPKEIILMDDEARLIGVDLLAKYE